MSEEFFLGVAFGLILAAAISVLIWWFLSSKDGGGRRTKRGRSGGGPVPSPSESTPDTEPRVVDPNNPPYYAAYRTDGYDPDNAPSCVCHKRKIGPGERILIWPIPDAPVEGWSDVFCEQTYSTAYPEGGVQ